MSVKVMILAAGRGERMRPLTDSCPKPLLHVAGRPLIEHHLEKLAAAGITDVVINHAYLGDQIESCLGDGRRWGLSIHYSPEQTALETAGGIGVALKFLGPKPFWVINSDIWTDWSYDILLDRQLQTDKLGHLVLVENPEHNPQGDFDLNRDLIVDRPQWTFAGAALYDPRMFADIPSGVYPLRRVFTDAIASKSLTGHIQPGYWCDVGTPQRLDVLNQKLKD